MRRLLALGALAALVWWLVGRRRRPGARVVVGYEDGTAVPLVAGSPERELLLGAAAEVLRR